MVDVFIAATRVISDQFKKNVADLRTTAVHIGTIEKSSRLKIFMKPVIVFFHAFETAWIFSTFWSTFSLLVYSSNPNPIVQKVKLGSMYRSWDIA